MLGFDIEAFDSSQEKFQVSHCWSFGIDLFLSPSVTTIGCVMLILWGYVFRRPSSKCRDIFAKMDMVQIVFCTWPNRLHSWWRFGLSCHLGWGLKILIAKTFLAHLNIVVYASIYPIYLSCPEVHPMRLMPMC